jgi:Ca2+-binding RTX toxin-like protein
MTTYTPFLPNLNRDLYAWGFGRDVSYTFTAAELLGRPLKPGEVVTVTNSFIIKNKDGTFTLPASKVGFGIDAVTHVGDVKTNIYIHTYRSSSYSHNQVGTETADIVFGKNTNGGTHDFIVTYGGNDIVFAAEGDDAVYAGSGNDIVSAGTGNDLVYGDTGHDLVHGEAGNDRVFGEAGNDTVFGGAGNDYIVGGEGWDNLFGDAGDDVIYTWKEDSYNFGTTAGDFASGGDGNDKIYAGTGNDKLLGGAGNDSIFAVAGDDWVYAGTGNDVLFGGSGNDVLFGEDGNDKLTGEVGKDILNGGNGDDVLTGGAESDSLRGGSGKDIFVFTEQDMSSRDIIHDFNRKFDKLDLSILLDSTTYNPVQNSINDFVKLTTTNQGTVLSVDFDGKGERTASNVILLENVTLNQNDLKTLIADGTVII